MQSGTPLAYSLHSRRGDLRLWGKSVTGLRRPLKKVWRSLLLVGSCLAFVVGGIIVLKVYEDTMRTHERGQLVSSIVEQQFHDLSSGSQAGNFRRVSLESWRDDSLELKQWVFQQSLKLPGGPAATSRRLENLDQTRTHSTSMQISLKHWQSALRRWAAAEKHKRFASEDFLKVARQTFFESAGLRKIGKSYDATVLYLWTISNLTRFIDSNPYDGKVPEALYMLVVAYMDLGHSLPTKMHGERILNLCSELYPDSFWANRSNGVWREAASNEI